MRPVAPPFNLGAGDLKDVAAELAERRRAFLVAYCTERGWPTDPAQLLTPQLFAIMDHPEWPR